MPQHIATWNATAGVWETTESLICGHSALFSATWPISGSMRSGRVYARPTWVPPTGGSECSWLPTPVADHSRGLPGKRGRDWGGDLAGTLIHGLT